MRKVFLDELPRKMRRVKNTINQYEEYIDWNNSVGCKVRFVYDDIEGELEILGYSKRRLQIKYNDDIKSILSYEFKNGRIGGIIGKISRDFKLKTGDIIVDDKRNITIIEREFRPRDTSGYRKYYKYKCNNCGNIDWIEESQLLHRAGCNSCGFVIKKPILGINTIWDTDRWMCDLGVSEKDAKENSYGSNKKIIVKCPDCGKEKEMKIYNIYKYKTINCDCEDNVCSYSEKIIISLLDQLKISYNHEYTPSWVNNKRYDFYFEYGNKKCIIECHGEQHYKQTTRKGVRTRTLQEEQENDEYKKNVAIKNNIDHYIVLDCRRSRLDWIKNSILNSELNNIFSLNEIDWSKCEEFTSSNIIKEVCNYWYVHNEKNNENLSTKDLSEYFGFTRKTISTYLKKGTEIGWCNYNPEEEYRKGCVKNINSKKVKMYKNDILLGVYNCSRDICNEFKDFNVNGIYSVCAGFRKTYKGYKFEYVESEEDKTC